MEHLYKYGYYKNDVKMLTETKQKPKQKPKSRLCTQGWSLTKHMYCLSNYYSQSLKPHSSKFRPPGHVCALLGSTLAYVVWTSTLASILAFVLFCFCTHFYIIFVVAILV